MTKKEFLDKLRSSLSVLEEGEQEDIVSEYEQHIDMKMKSGLTEEAAIDDFGSIQELTTEILEAYHVRADYAAKKRIADKNNSIYQKMQDYGKKTIEACKNGMNWLGKTIRHFFETNGERIHQVGIQFVQYVKNGVKKMARNQTNGLEDTTEQMTTQDAMQDSADTGSISEDSMTIAAENRDFIQKHLEASTNHGFFRKRHGQQTQSYGSEKEKRTFVSVLRDMNTSLLHGMGAMISLCIQLAVLCVKLGWNLCWICFGVFTGLCTVVSLFLMGMFAVVLTQGYPLVGVMIGCLGLACCFGAVTGLSFSILCHLKETDKTVQEKGGEIVCVE